MSVMQALCSSGKEALLVSVMILLMLQAFILLALHRLKRKGLFAALAFAQFILLFLMFFLIGINIIDLLTAKKSQFDGERLDYVRTKTHKKYSIKVEPEAKMLIDKYAGTGEYLVDALDHCKHYSSFMHEMNDALKTITKVVQEEIPEEGNLFAEPHIITKVVPLIPDITTYYSRHTWATLAHEIGISSDIISLALGHSPANRTTFIYIKPDQSKVDDANRKVIDYFFGKVTDIDDV